MEQIEGIAFVIPIHPPHYHYLYTLLDKLKENNITIDIFLVFSTEDDYNMFEMKAEIKPIVLNTEINKKSIITFKKFFALNYLIPSKYEYFICCDAEIDIIPKNFNAENIKEKLTNIFKNKSIYAGHLNGRVDISIINIKCATIFEEHYYELAELTEDFMLYWWYSDINVYRRADLEDFFKTIRYNEITPHLLYEHFDYIIYQYYLIIKERFTIINTTDITGVNWSFERLYNNHNNIEPHKTIINRLSDIKYGFGWVNKILYERNIDNIVSKGTFIIYNLDRLEVKT